MFVALLARNQLLPVTVLVGLTVIGSVLAVGTIHIQALLAIAPFAIAAGAWTIARTGRGLRAIPPPAWVFFALALYSVLQAVPLPAALLRGISPAAESAWVRSLTALGEPTGWLSLSLDPSASVTEALKWFCYGSMFCAGAAISAVQSRRVVPAIIFTSALLAALVALGHRLVSAESLYGLYTPLAPPSAGMAPLINGNNFAGYLNLGVFAGLGLLMSWRPVAPRWATGLAISIVIGMSAACGSRAGLASLAFGMLALITMLWLVKLDGSRALIWVPISALLGGIALFALVMNVDMWHAMVAEGAKKIALISWTAPVVRDFPLFGIGRGAFESVFPAYRADTGHHLYQFAENFVMQWCVEWGVPVALAACCAFAYTLRPKRSKRSSGPSEALTLCCAIGALVLLLQNLLDLALEVASVALALSVLLGGLWSRPQAERSDTSATPERASRRPFAAFLAAGVSLWVLTAIVGIPTVQDERETIAEQLREPNDAVSFAALGDALHLAIARHPAEPYFPLVAASLNRGRKGPEMAWISRAIERDPMAGRPYLLLAQALARRGANAQALQAVRLAVEHEYALIGPGTTLALSLTHQIDELKTTVPAGVAGVGMLVHLARQAELAAFHEQLLREAMDRDRNALEPRLVRAEDLLNALDSKGPLCAEPRRAACVTEVRTLAAAFAIIDPTSARSVVVQARLSMAQGNAGFAERLLAEKCKTFIEQSDCARVRFLAAELAGDRSNLDDASAALLAEACATQSECASTANWLGGRLLLRGDPVGALRMYQRAAQESETTASWQRVAEMANTLGLTTVAAQAVRRAGAGETPKQDEFPRTLEERRAEEHVRQMLDAGVH